jgi:hypothetical protein
VTLEDNVLTVLSGSLGRSAPTFLKRQLTAHMHKEAGQLTKEDIDELAKWCFIGVSLVLDEKTAAHVRDELIKLKH